MTDEYVCDECGRRRATVHLTDVVDGRAVQRHLCARCYMDKEGGVTVPPGVVLAQLLSAMVPELKEMGAPQCPACGTNYLEFRQSLRLGCPNDYEVFDTALEQLVTRMHGSAAHCGKVSPVVGADEAVRTRIRSLQERQRKAISEEDYELAARLRDRIRELEKHGSAQAE
jgi:protein arginine kinase activator